MRVLIDGKEVVVAKPKTVLEIALEEDIYIPHLCYYPALSAPRGVKPADTVYQGKKFITGTESNDYEGCGLCLVEILGKGVFYSCSTISEEGMVIQTHSEELKRRRRENLIRLLENHPHDCLVCVQSEGCDRKICSLHIPEHSRCCWKFGKCEFQGVVDFVGIDERGVNPYKPKELPLVDDNPLFTRDYNLCIGCLRCVVACRELAGSDALRFVTREGDVIVGTREERLKESGCKFCLACVEVCSTGALKDKDPKRKKSRIRAGISSAILPPEKGLVLFKREEVEKVPEVDGVCRLWNEDRELYQITGTDNLRAFLLEQLKDTSKTYYFDYEEDLMYTTRERQLIQLYLKKFGRLPPGNDEDEDLF